MGNNTRNDVYDFNIKQELLDIVLDENLKEGAIAWYQSILAENLNVLNDVKAELYFAYLVCSLDSLAINYLGKTLEIDARFWKINITNGNHSAKLIEIFYFIHWQDIFVVTLDFDQNITKTVTPAGKILKQFFLHGIEINDFPAFYISNIEFDFLMSNTLQARLY